MALLIQGSAGRLERLEPGVVVPLPDVLSAHLAVFGAQVLLESGPVGVAQDAEGQTVLAQLGVNEA